MDFVNADAVHDTVTVGPAKLYSYVSPGIRIHDVIYSK